MKYSLSGRQPISILKKCDEIKMAYADKDRIIDYIEALPTKTIILEVPKEVQELNWNLFQKYSENINFILCLYDLSLAAACKEHNIQFYWAYPINTYYELRGVIALNPCYLFLGAPLCFDLPNIKSITNIPIRLCPNVTYDAYIPREDGICGQWIRPEDTEVYEEYVDTYDFVANELQREQVLFHVYKDNGNWPGNLNLLFTNFNCNIDNRIVPADLAQARVKCGQRCMCAGSTCHLCETAMKFATAVHNEVQSKDKN